MVDKYAEIANESIRRLVEQSEGQVQIEELPPDCPLREYIDPEQIRKQAALCVAMTRIIDSAELN